MTSQKYSRAALLRLAFAHCHLSGARGNYLIRSWDDTRNCYRETPAGNYAWGVGSVRDARIAYCAGLLGLPEGEAYRAQGLYTRIEDAVDALLMIANDLAQNDKRYAVELEHCGRGKPQYVARFCGGWVGRAPDKGDAWALAQAHKVARQ